MENAITGVIRSYRYYAGITCMCPALWPLENHSPIGVSTVLGVRERWCRFVEKAKDTGDIRFQGKRGDYLAKCLPFGVRTKLFARSCRLSLLCPFCYARNFVFNVFAKAEQLIGTKSDLVLVSFRRSKELQAGSILDLVEKIKYKVDKHRLLDYKTAKAVGGTVLHSIDMHTLPLLRVRVHRFGLLVCRRKHVDDFDYNVASCSLSELTKRKIYMLLRSRFGMTNDLDRCSPALVFPLLDALRGVRMITSYGSFRRKDD